MIKGLLRLIIGKRYYDYFKYASFYRRLLKRHGFPNVEAEGEKEYVKRWSCFGRVEPYSYRLFSHFCGPNKDIIPEDICHNVIEAKLNPVYLWDIYEDKNNFAHYVGAKNVPRTIAYRQHGGEIIHCSSFTDLSSLFLKPSLGTSCGEGIIRLDNRQGKLYYGDRLVTDEFLLGYGNDFVLQEGVVQHPFFSRLNPSSVNTLRLVVYRSVVDDEPHLTEGMLRIGKSNSIVDNTIAGGCYLAVDVRNGRVGKRAFGNDALTTTIWNGIDFSKEDLTIPCWDKFIALSYHVAKCIPDHHLIALDICLDEKEKPILIEYNIGGFSAWVFYYLGQTVFGPFTDEVIRYCLSR